MLCDRILDFRSSNNIQLRFHLNYTDRGSVHLVTCSVFVMAETTQPFESVVLVFHIPFLMMQIQNV